MIIKILALIGGMVVGLIAYDVVGLLYKKIKRWRKNNCRIKCLCKPHIWEMEWLWYNSGEACLTCKKCGKQKKLIISTDSFEKMFGVNKKGNFRWTREGESEE